MRALRFLLRKEYLQIGRDRTLLAQLLMMPIIQLLVLSSAATFEVRRARMVVVDHDRSTMSHGIAERLAATGRFVPVGTTPSMALADDAMLGRRADMILVVPAGFERDLVRDRVAQVQLLLDAENGAAAGVTQAYAREVLADYARELGVSIRARPPAGAPPGAARVAPGPVVEVRRRGWYNAELEYRDYMVPGILVQLVTMIGTLMTAMNIVREKEAGTLDQLNVTPIARSTFIAAKLIPLWTIALIELAAGLVVARFVFGVPMEGSLLLVFGAAAIYLIAALGVGLWISTVVETQQQAMFVTFFIMLVYLLMSGLFTPVRSMPAWAQWFAALNPMMHFIELMRAVLLKGAGLADVARQLLVLAGFSAVALTLAIRQYDKRTA